MKRLSEFKGDEAVEVIADLLEPIGNICTNPDIQELVNAKEETTVLKLAKAMLKRSKADVLAVMAILNERPLEEYKANVTAVDLLIDTVQLLNDKELMSLFI